MQGSKNFLVTAVVLAAAAGAAVFLWPKKEGVTIYCAADEPHAQPILDAFTRDTGIPIRHVEYDAEANKTVSLVLQLSAKKANPDCDVFWNNEPLHSMRLAEEGVFEPYVSPSAADIPSEFKDPQNRWTGFAGRARVLIVNTQVVKPDEMPKSMDDLADPKWRGRVAFARPLSGTTLTQAAVLWTVLGKEKTLGWCRSLHSNGCAFPPGNGPVAATVGLGQLAWGFTDTDDFRKQQVEGRPVTIVYPDQGAGQPGTLVLPNTVALIRGAPRADLGKKLIDYILRKETESQLAHSDGAHIPLRKDVARPAHVKGPPDFRAMPVDWSDVARNYDERLEQFKVLWQ